MSTTIGILRVEISASGVRAGGFRGDVELLDPRIIRELVHTQLPGVVALVKLRPDGWLELENVRQVFVPEAV